MALPQRYAGKDHYTEDEYLAWEKEASDKSEYFRGEIRAMSGGSPEHGAIAANTIGALVIALRDKECQVLSSDVKIRTRGSAYVYPDVSVVCGPVQVLAEDPDVVTNPLVIAEVLSDSTERRDRGEKFMQYQTIPTLRDYLLIAQDTPRIELYTRQEDHWVYYTTVGREGQIHLPSLETMLALSDVYRRIRFAADQDMGPIR